MPRVHPHRLGLALVALAAAAATTLPAAAAPVSAAPAISPAARRGPTATAAVATSTSQLAANTSRFRGVNWADPRDNYASDEVVPSGLDTDDSYRTTYRKSTKIVKGFRSELRANTVRLPINPSSVGTDWWKSYRGAIDAATDQGSKVIVSYWESDGAKDGKIDDLAAYNTMWDTVVKRYGTNKRVYFEPMNEPFGYSLDSWVSTTSRWLSRHYEVPRSRVLISGTGYNDNVTGVGAAPELRGTLLSLHFYGYWASDTNEAAWKANLEPRIGEYGWRTVVDEAGSPMTTGLNYGNHEGNVSTAYLGALTETVRAQRMGLVYWPGLRTGDSYSMTTLTDNNRLEVTNESGLAQLQWGWRLLRKEPLNDLPPAPPGEPLRNTGGGRCLDVPGGSTTAGTTLDLWECNGGGNQSWNLAAGKVSVYATSCLSVSGGLNAGNPVQIADCGDVPEQRWTLKGDGTLDSTTNPALCLAASGDANGSAVVVERCTDTARQRWTRV